MKYFTPELYVRFNSPDEKVADRADREWEDHIEKYEQYLNGVRDRLPTQIRKLTELHNHDARILSRVEEIQAGRSFPFREFPFPFPTSWSAVSVVALKTDETIRSLIYSLWDRTRVRPYDGEWPFSKEAEHWMYDELDFDLDYPGACLHRVLLSSGAELEIPFTSVIVHEFSLTPAEPAAAG
jgi:hypothetical protein